MKVPIPGFPGYLADSDGFIWSTRRGGLRLLPGWLDARGRPKVRVNDTQTAVSRLLCTAFHGLPPFEGAVARHLDGDHANNDIDNIAWGSQADNAADARRHGTWLHGERVPWTKLTEEKVREIRRRVDNGETHGRIAAGYGVSRKAVCDAANRKKWKHVR